MPKQTIERSATIARGVCAVCKSSDDPSVQRRALQVHGLIEFFAEKRLELAARIDRGELTEDQAKLETQKVYASIQATERQRDAAR